MLLLIVTGQQDCTPYTTLATTPATSLATTIPAGTALHCTLYTLITHCFSSATTTQVIVPEKYRSDFEDIQDRFAQLFEEVSEILENEESVTI